MRNGGGVHLASDGGNFALDIQDLTIDLSGPAGIVEAVSGVSLGVEKGRALALVGESGSGKTLTALATINLLPRVAKISAGVIRVHGTDVLTANRHELRRLRGREVGVVFQDPLTALNPALQVGEQIAERLRYARGWSRKAARARAVELIDLVGIANASRRAREYPHQFSGGMRQRIMFAMAVSCEPSVLIADEPTTALDVTTQAQIVRLIADLRREFQLALVFISHDLSLVGAMCDEVAVMYAGQIVERGDAGLLLADPQHPYTRLLLEAIPNPEAYQPELTIIGGRPPMPGSFPSGCRFGPRCPARLVGACDVPIELWPSGEGLSRCVRAAQPQFDGGGSRRV